MVLLQCSHFPRIINQVTWKRFRMASASYSAYRSFTKLAIFQEKMPMVCSSTCRPLFFTCAREYAKGFGGKKPKGSKAKAHLTDDEMLEVIDIHAYRSQLQSIIDRMKADFIANLAVRTSPGSIETLQVDIEGQSYALNELAQISRKNPNLIAVNMSGFPEGLKPALKAINESGLGLNPQQEGTMIYLPVPKVTREHREKLAKNARAMFVKAKDDIRNVQNAFIRDAKQKTELSEDLVFSAQQQLTSMAEECAKEAEKMMKTKQKDLLGDS